MEHEACSVLALPGRTRFSISSVIPSEPHHPSTPLHPLHTWDEEVWMGTRCSITLSLSLSSSYSLSPSRSLPLSLSLPPSPSLSLPLLLPPPPVCEGGPGRRLGALRARTLKPSALRSLLLYSSLLSSAAVVHFFSLPLNSFSLSLFISLAL